MPGSGATSHPRRTNDRNRKTWTDRDRLNQANTIAGVFARPRPEAAAPMPRDLPETGP
jgi:hypothetical protein